MNYPMTIDLFTSEEEICRINKIDMEINDELKKGSGFKDGKYRIYQICTSPISKQIMQKALSLEYGIGGHSAVTNSPIKGVDYNSHGIKFRLSDEDFVLLDWSAVLKRITNLINSGDYMLGYEIDRYNKIICEPDFYNFGLIKATTKEEDVDEEEEE